MSFSVEIDRIVDLLGLERDPKHAGAGTSSYFVACPFCGEKYKLNINPRKNVYNCVTCASDSGGGALDLYTRVVLGERLRTGPSGNSKKAFAKLMEDLGENKNPLLQRATAAKKLMPKEEYSPIRADDEILNRVYSALLDFPEFCLSDEHRHNLLHRGLSEELIERNKYRSITDYNWASDYKKYNPEIGTYLSEILALKELPLLSKAGKNYLLACAIVGQYLCNKTEGDLYGVPGAFYWKKHWFFHLDSGMIIPTRNTKGEITCLQFRKSTGNRRYFTISSKGLPEGVERGISRTHFPLGNSAINKDTKVLLTEGPLKADVAQSLMPNSFFIAIQGVKNVNELPSIFRDLKAQGVTTVLNALDMDKLTNIHVLKALKAIEILASKEGLKLRAMYWGKEDVFSMFARMQQECLSNKLLPEFREDMYQSIIAMSQKLYQADIPYLRDEDGNHDYWPAASKGIDDYLSSIDKANN